MKTKAAFNDSNPIDILQPNDLEKKILSPFEIDDEEFKRIGYDFFKLKKDEKIRDASRYRHK